jgi:hypothetical protein
MRIERTWFNGADPNPKKVKIADSPVTEHAFDYFPDGRVEIFIPTDGGPGGHIVTLTREEVERLQ